MLKKFTDFNAKIIAIKAEIAELEPTDIESLAAAYYKLGEECCEIQTLPAFEQAVVAYEQAIDFREQLPMEDDESIAKLAKVYNSCGAVLCDRIQTPIALHKAVKYFQNVIALSKKLSLDEEKYLYGYATGYFNLGNAQYKLGSPNDLQQAINAYQQAISIREKLIREKLLQDNPEFQNDLVKAYGSLGNAQSDSGSPSDLQQAIKAYQQAISIGEKLPQDNPQFQNDLAGAYANCSGAQNQLGQFAEAITSANQAIEISEGLDKQVLAYIDFKAKAFGNKAIACLNKGDFEEANEAAETGLDLLRDLEIKGNYVLRPLREWLFDVTIDTYSVQAYFNFLPEFVLEHLDAKNLGAAPQSEAMHRAALRGLQELAVFAYSEYPELIPEIGQTIIRLTQIASQYFAGTATAAKLLAQYHHQNRQDPKQAEQVLKDYTHQCPNDADGYHNLGEFYRNETNWAAAVQCYTDGATAIGTSLPKRATNQDIEQASNAIALFIDSCILLRLQQSNQIAKEYYALVNWLIKFSKEFPEELQSLLDTRIENQIIPELTQKHQVLLEANVTKQVKAEITKQLDQNASKIGSFLKVLPKNYQNLVQSILKLQADLLEVNATEVDVILPQHMKKLIQGLRGSEFEAEFAELNQQFQEIWSKLDAEERKTLAIARRFLQNDELLFAAGVSLGIALERSIIINWLQPVRASLPYNPGFPLNIVSTEAENDHLETILFNKYFQNPEMESKL